MITADHHLDVIDMRWELLIIEGVFFLSVYVLGDGERVMKIMTLERHENVNSTCWGGPWADSGLEPALTVHDLRGI